MSVLTTITAAAAATLAIAYGAGRFAGPSLYTEIEIDAPASTVWAEFSDTANYPGWNPFVKRLSGDLEPGNRLEVTIQAEGNSPMNFTPEVLVAEKNHELRWVGRLGFKGIFDGEHYFILEETEEGTTLFRHGENFTGVLAHVVLPLIRKDTQTGFEAMNEALKTRVENQG